MSVSFNCDVPPVGEELLRCVMSKVNDLRSITGSGSVKAFASKNGVIHFLFPEPEDKIKGITMSPNPSWN